MYSSTAVALAAAAVDTRDQSVRAGISMFSRSPAITGTGDGSVRRPPLAEFGAMWGGRGAVARPRGVRWRSREPALRGAYQN